MGIEGGSIGSVNVGPAIGPSIRGISSGIEGGFGARGGPSLGGIRGGIADLEATVPLGRIGFSIVNEGPVIPEALNIMDIVAKPISPKILGEIVFKPSQPLVIQQAVVPSGTRQAMEVAAAAWEVPSLNAADAISVLEQPKVAIVPNIIPAQMPDHLAQPEPVVAPHVVPRAEPMVLSWVEPAPALQVSPSPLPQPLLQEQEVEEIVTEKITKENTGLVEEEGMVEERMYLEDEEASAQRRHEVKEAVGKTRAEADRLGLKKIAGWLVAKFLPSEHPGNRSQVVKEKGPDGSYQETVEAIASSGEFSSEEQAEKRLAEIVAEKKPVKNGKRGNPAKNEDVARVFKYHVVRPAVTHEIVVKRSETSLEDDPELAEVFGRAA